MDRTERAARRRRSLAAARRLFSLDVLVAGVVLVTATGFRFLAQHHFAHAGAPTPEDLLIAIEVVLIPLALAAMIIAGRRQRWRDMGLTTPLGGAGGVAVAITAAALLLVLFHMAPPLPSSPAVSFVAPGLVLAEELLRRGFLLNELVALMGGDHAARAAALGLLALAEAVAHAPAGAAAAIAAAGGEVVLGVAYLAAGRSLWIPILARALAHAGLRAALSG